MDDEIDPRELTDKSLTLPGDPYADARVALQRKYDFRPVIDATYDAIAQEILDHFQLVPGRGVAGVNYLDEKRDQFFVGVAGADLRQMSCEQGACSTLIAQPKDLAKPRRAMAMGDLLDFPLFATNDMVTKFGMRTYLGAHIIPPEGVPIGTLWWIDTEPRRWTQADLNFMKAQAAKVMQSLLDRASQ